MRGWGERHGWGEGHVVKYQPRGGYFTTVGGRTSTAFGRLVEESVLLRKANFEEGFGKRVRWGTKHG